MAEIADGRGCFLGRSPLGVLRFAPHELTPSRWSWTTGSGNDSHQEPHLVQRIERPAPGGAEASPPLTGGPTSPPGAWVADSQAAIACCGRG